MKITLHMSGGFAAIPILSQPVTVDTDTIDSQLADQLKSFVQESNFFDYPAQTAEPTRGAADYRTYTITVEDGLRAHSIQFTDPIPDPALERLVSSLRGMAYRSKP